MTFKNTKTKKSTTKKYRCVVKAANKPVEEKSAKITAIKQEKASTLTATFSADVTGVTYGAVSVVRDETKAVVTVKSITVDKKDNTKATIETYEALSDGKAYTVTYKAADGTESSATFTATDGTVADIALNTYSIPANTPTEMKYQTLDANGVIIEEKGIGSAKSNYMDISVENVNGYQNDNELLLYKTGDTATIKAVYHTFKYNNTNGSEEGKVEKTFTITAVDQSTVIETFGYTVTTKANRAAVDFEHDKLSTQIAMDDDKNSSYYAQFKFLTAANKDITETLDYNVSSGNENVLLASGTVAGGAQLNPVGVGATYLVIKDASGKVVTTLPVTVVAKRSLSTMTVDKSSVTISETAGTVGDQKITVAAMDQYSEPYDNYVAKNLEEKTNKSVGTLDVKIKEQTKNKTIISVSSGSKATVGTYTYTMDLEDKNNSNNTKKVSFTVIVSRKLANNATYVLVMMNGTDNVSKVDTTVTTDTFEDIILKPTVVVKNNGSITEEANVTAISDLKVTKSSGTLDNTNNRIYNANAKLVSEAAIRVATGAGIEGDPITKWLTPGTYNVSFKATISGVTGVQDMSTSFVVEDSQKEFKASVKKEKVESNSEVELKDIFTNKNYVTFTYAGHELKLPYSFDSAKYSKDNDGSIRVNTVTMSVPLPDANGQYVNMTADVNRTFTFTSGVLTDEIKDARELADAYANSVTSQAIERLENASGASLKVNFAGIAELASGASISISNVVMLGDPSNNTNTSCAAISGAGIASGDALTFTPATVDKDSTLKEMILTFPKQVTTDDIEDNDTIEISFTLTVSCTVDGQKIEKALKCKATYKWTTDKWAIDGTVTVS